MQVVVTPAVVAPAIDVLTVAGYGQELVAM